MRIKHAGFRPHEDIVSDVDVTMPKHQVRAPSMANRFLSPDPSRWTGPTHLGSGPYSSSKRVSKFVFDGPTGSSVAKLRTAYVGAIDAVNTLRTKRQETDKSKRFTPLGTSEHVAEHAMTDNIPALRRARATAEKIKAEIADTRSKLTLAKPTDEQRRDHEEIRAAMRSMTADQRAKFIDGNRQNPLVVGAIAHASIPELIGMSQHHHKMIVDDQMQQEHGETLAELADLEEVVGVVDRLTNLARDEMREIIGVSKDVFESVARVGEAGDGELPFRVEERQIGGETKEICRIYDFAAKQWRDASADEIQKVAA
ncbi:hypothetical protein [Bradyrhizobium sp. BWC-3-1]|uniref:hypothetical protein n=1 Tax=Bradyrhizobium sp. BWC-3-1 TaxID=3080012 RepID=UPI00293EC2D0|nr:hypothetical protein [Bradyrhizobium sp. BWC-3-1]WOH55047.1 hypothetical protein RX329_22235 [Bradyrhizobium sp. BWC-3-1]